MLHLFLRHGFSCPDNVILFYIFHVNPKLFLPLFQIGHSGVHAQRTAAEITKGHSLQPLYRCGGSQEIHHFVENLRLPDRTPQFLEFYV